MTTPNPSEKEMELALLIRETKLAERIIIDETRTNTSKILEIAEALLAARKSAYARGVEDAAKVAESLELSGVSHLEPPDLARRVLEGAAMQIRRLTQGE